VQYHALPALAREHIRQLQSEARTARHARQAPGGGSRRASAPPVAPLAGAGPAAGGGQPGRRPSPGRRAPIRNRAGWALVSVGLRLAGSSGDS
jgi:hypothetical protein